MEWHTKPVWLGYRDPARSKPHGKMLGEPGKTTVLGESRPMGSDLERD
jgi:hypothetical protein